MDNDTCSCVLGYKGKLCTESGMPYCTTCTLVTCTVFTCVYVLHMVQCSEGGVRIYYIAYAAVTVRLYVRYIRTYIVCTCHCVR